MNVTLTPELQTKIDEKVRNGDYKSADELIGQALCWFFDTKDEGAEEEGKALAEIRCAIEESLGQAERGQTVSLDEFDKRIRAKYGIPR